MKRFLIIIALLCSYCGIQAQSLSPEETRAAMSSLDSLLTAYTTLGTLIEPGLYKVSDPAKKQYLTLFKDTMVQVYGDLLAEHNAVLVKAGKNPKLVTVPVY